MLWSLSVAQINPLQFIYFFLADTKQASTLTTVHIRYSSSPNPNKQNHHKLDRPTEKRSKKAFFRIPHLLISSGKKKNLTLTKSKFETFTLFVRTSEKFEFHCFLKILLFNFLFVNIAFEFQKHFKTF